MNRREAVAVRGLSTLGEQTFVRFLRAVRGDENCTTVRLANEAMDSGQAVTELFLTGEELGFHLSASALGKGRFRVEFGCVAGPVAGDGGSWEFAVDASGRVIDVAIKDIWIS